VFWIILHSPVFFKELGKKAEPYIDDGQLVPDEIMFDLILGELAKLKNANWLLDGKYNY